MSYPNNHISDGTVTNGLDVYHQCYSIDQIIKWAIAENNFEGLAIVLSRGGSSRRYYAVTDTLPCQILESLDSNDPDEIERFLSRHNPKNINVTSRIVEIITRSNDNDNP